MLSKVSSQALCGLATSLFAVYAIRLGTGIFSAAIIPAAFAFVADTTATRSGRGAWRS